MFLRRLLLLLVSHALFYQHNNKPVKLNKIMEPKTMKWSVSDQLQETCAGSSLGFRRKENEYDAAQDEKGGVGVWLN